MKMWIMWLMFALYYGWKLRWTKSGQHMKKVHKIRVINLNFSFHVIINFAVSSWYVFALLKPFLFITKLREFCFFIISYLSELGYQTFLYFKSLALRQFFDQVYIYIFFSHVLLVKFKYYNVFFSYITGS